MAPLSWTCRNWAFLIGAMTRGKGRALRWVVISGGGLEAEECNGSMGNEKKDVGGGLTGSSR